MSAPAADDVTDLAEPAVRETPVTRPFRWLAEGWKDFTQAPLPSALHGLLAAAGGGAILVAGWGNLFLLFGAFSGFLLVAPILATGLYALSRAIERGKPANLGVVLAAWRSGTKPLVTLGLILMLLGTLWVLMSAVAIAVFTDASIANMHDFVRNVLFARDSYLFEAWMMVGGFLASLVFACTVVSAPMLLDRDTDLLTAASTSIRAVASNPICMALWAAIIMTLTLLGMATLLWGLVLVIPLVGHASWHAYRDVVDATDLPERR